MGTVLSHGLTKPANKDRRFWTWIEELFTAFNDHTHNGTNSELITISNISKSTATILAANWVADGAMYYQNITLPTGYAVDSTIFKFQDTSTGDIIAAEISKLSANSYKILVNSNSLELKAVYG